LKLNVIARRAAAKQSIFAGIYQKVVDGRMRGHDAMLDTPMTQKSKSFLVLFFKKEPLTFS
jgi:hypothetical protein